MADGFDVAGHARVEAQRGDDLLAVLQLEQALNRLAVAGRRGHVDDAARVGDAEVGEEDAGRARAAGEGREHGVAFPQPRRRQVLHVLLPLHPAVARDDHDVVFLDDEVVGGVFGLAGVARDHGAALVEFRVRVLFCTSSSSPRTSFQRLSSSLRSAAICRARFRFSSSSFRMIEDFEAGEAVDLQLEDRVGLLGVERRTAS